MKQLDTEQRLLSDTETSKSTNAHYILFMIEQKTPIQIRWKKKKKKKKEN